MGNFNWTTRNLPVSKTHFEETVRLMAVNNAKKHPLVAASTFKLGYLRYFEAATEPLQPETDLSCLSTRDAGGFNQALLKQAMFAYQLLFLPKHDFLTYLARSWKRL